MKKTANVKTLEKRFKCCSVYGNPSYFVDFITDDGLELTGYTASNASCGYAIGNYVNKDAEIVYHWTRSGKLVIDYIDDVKTA